MLDIGKQKVRQGFCDGREEFLSYNFTAQKYQLTHQLILTENCLGRKQEKSGICVFAIVWLLKMLCFGAFSVESREKGCVKYLELNSFCELSCNSQSSPGPVVF